MSLNTEVTSHKNQSLSPLGGGTTLKTTPRLTVIIPVYNVEIWLSSCLRSLSSQTLKEVEFIVINDASPDHCGDLLGAWALTEVRAKVVHFSENQGTYAARNYGIAMASAPFITFIDSDDYYPSADTLETLITTTEKINVDILQFHINCVGQNVARNNDVAQWFNCPNKDYEIRGSENIILNSFSDSRQASWNLCNKVFRTDILKKTIKLIPNEHIVCAEDAFLYFVYCLFSESYQYLSNLNCYTYRVGVGISTSTVCLTKFEDYVDEPKIIELLEQVLITLSLESQGYHQALSWFKENLFNTLLFRFKALPAKDMVAGLSLLLKNHSSSIILRKIKEHNIFCDNKFREVVSSLDFPHVTKEIKTIAVYVGTYQAGVGKQDIDWKIELLQKLGYKIILITDLDEKRNSSHLGSDTQWNIISGSYLKGRGDDLLSLVQSHSIDAVIYHGDNQNLWLYDTTLLKSINVKVVFNLSGYSATQLRKGLSNFFHEIQALCLADKVIVSNQIDETFYRQYGINCNCLPIPISFDTFRSYSQPTRNRLLWVGVIDMGEDFQNVLKFFKKIIEAQPHTICELVGPASNDRAKETLDQYLRSQHLENNIIWQGPQTNLQPFFESAALLLVTDCANHVPSTIQTALNLGVPTVCTTKSCVADFEHINPHLLIQCNDEVDTEVCVVVDILNNQQRYDCIGKENLNAALIESKLQKWQNFLSDLAKPKKQVSTEQLHMLYHLQLISNAVNNYDKKFTASELLTRCVVETKYVYADKTTPINIQRKIYRYDRMVEVIKRIAPDGSFRKNVLLNLLRILNKCFR